MRARLFLGSVAMFLLAAGGMGASCDSAPQLFLQGQVLAAPSGERAGQPLPGIRVRYRLTLTLKDGAQKALEFSPETETEGRFYIELERIDGVSDPSQIATTHAEVSVDGTDWSPADAVVPPEPNAREDRFVLKTPFVSIAVASVALRNGAHLAASQASLDQAVHQASLIWNSCGIALVPVSYAAIDATSSHPYSPSTYTAINQTRKDLGIATRLTLAVTGPWDRTAKSDLAGDDSLAYGAIPSAANPTAFGGVVAEPSALGHPAIIAHEIGHTLNLLHVDQPETDQVDDTTAESVGTATQAGGNLMFHITSEKSTALTPGQCARARTALSELRSTWEHPWENTPN